LGGSLSGWSERRAAAWWRGSDTGATQKNGGVGPAAEEQWRGAVQIVGPRRRTAQTLGRQKFQQSCGGALARSDGSRLSAALGFRFELGNRGGEAFYLSGFLACAPATAREDRISQQLCLIR
jgi:hypothetical protein